MSLDEIRNERLKKLALLKERGIDPYPVSSHPDITIRQTVPLFDELLCEGKEHVLAGRVVRLRRQGGMIFFDLDDGTGRMQGALQKGKTDDDAFSLFVDAVDVGDFVELRGSFFLTKRGERTLLVVDWRMLAKSLRPLPEKWHGLKHVEERYRRRYLDTLSSPEAKERFVLRARLISFLRSFLDGKGYLEVETPALQPIYGGASAMPFVTRHNALGRDLYLRISNELYLKRLLVGGYPKVYEVYKGFRNEGIDATHYPEFTMVEFYECFSDAEKQMAFVEELLRSLVGGLCPSLSISYGGEAVDFSKKFDIASYFELFARHAGLAAAGEMTREELAAKAGEIGATVEAGASEAKILDAIFKKACRPKIIRPTFIVDYPACYLPLAKKKTGDEKLVDAFQLVAGGIELGKAFSELNDPAEQRERFAAEERLKAAGDSEAQPLDEDFLEALEYGMPPAGGVGIGIDRLVMLLSGVVNIKETILFPTMRAKE